MAVQYCQVHPLPYCEGQERCVRAAHHRRVSLRPGREIHPRQFKLCGVFYIADILMVAADLVLTLRNRRLDRERDNI